MGRAVAATGRSKGGGGARGKWRGGEGWQRKWRGLGGAGDNRRGGKGWQRGRVGGVEFCICAVGDRIFCMDDANTVSDANLRMPLSFCVALLESGLGTDLHPIKYEG